MRALVVAVILLAGCQSAPVSYNDAIGSAYAAVDALARTTEELCLASVPGGECHGSLPTDVRDDVRHRLQFAVEILDEAREFGRTGSTDVALQRVAEARQILAAVERLVETDR